MPPPAISTEADSVSFRDGYRYIHVLLFFYCVVAAVDVAVVVVIAVGFLSI